MASKSVGLFVLFQLLALNVVSQISAFPTPTASADGELAIASNHAIKMCGSGLVLQGIFCKNRLLQKYQRKLFLLEAVRHQGIFKTPQSARGGHKTHMVPEV